MNKENKHTDTTSALAAAACGIAWRAAQAWLTKNNRHAEPDALAAWIKAQVKSAVGQALADATRAVDLGMYDAAVGTFQGSMILAGIEAAKDASSPISLETAVQ